MSIIRKITNIAIYNTLNKTEQINDPVFSMPNNNDFFNQFEGGSNVTVTIINHLLEDFIQEHHRLPRKLHLCLGNINWISFYDEPLIGKKLS